MLLAAGFAPRYRHTSLDDPAMATIVASLQRLLVAHEPYPGVVLDRHWNVILANRAVMAFVDLLPVDLARPPMNVFRASLHPAGLARYTVGFDAWASYLLRQLNRLVTITADPILIAIRDEIHGYPNIVELRARRNWMTPTDSPDLLVPFQLKIEGVELSMFTTLTTFGTPRDITLDELAVELFFPSDPATATRFTEQAPLSSGLGSR